MFQIFEYQIIESAKRHKGHILIRKQQCLGCDMVLAIEITGKLGQRGEYWVAKDAIRSQGGCDFLFGQEVWFGNKIRCPNCGRIGRLPMDKPMAAEEIEKPKEVKNANKEILRKAREKQSIS